ncbi:MULTISPECIES: (deoxy)nucleoside triphosphate pyrophosphohydrolase [unclassified Mumia]|uniref:(deoxy)nucleoside triphosphate pyrophosphohydrolase n=1 Tax=unclassified Mumia TaxID=2621872 RepID=UPI00262B3957|nr:MULTISPECIES: NUDIX domain-containing protein [unclassified Mumia]MDD9350156.1 NUDIX domain-containing protein [Mumia sp.]
MDPQSPEPSPSTRVVVGVALIRAGRVLAARRTRPAAAAGGWELPGGKVEPGESEAEAARREVAEELGCDATVGHRLAGEVPLSGALVLRAYVGEIVSGEPEPTEHDLLRWLGPDELDSVAWLDADRPFLPELEALLRRTPSPTVAEAHFDEGEDAEHVLEQLHAQGFAASVHREGFAGEDDSEDRAWLVRVEDPAAAHRLEELVDEVDLAWMVVTGPAPVVPPPDAPPLPSGPRRLKRG